MLLQDHFQPPLCLRRNWRSFHSAWCTYLSSHINAQLPVGYFAESFVQQLAQLDVVDEDDPEPSTPWQCPPPTYTAGFAIERDRADVLIFERAGPESLAGAIVCVSPEHKESLGQSESMLSKCAVYLQSGAGLILIDIVNDRRDSLHEQLHRRFDRRTKALLRAGLYAVSYRPVERFEQDCLDIGCEELAVAKALPTLPLWLRGNICLRIDLGTTYERTCREQRITALAD